MENKTYKLDVDLLGRRVIELIKEITPIFLLDNGFYILSNSELLANKTIILEAKDGSKEIFLTGPMSLKFFSELMYARLGLYEYLGALIRQTEMRLRGLISRDISLDVLDYCKYVDFFLRLAEREFGVKKDKILSFVEGSMAEREVSKALMFLQEEKNKSLEFLHQWDIKKLLFPEEGKIRVITKKGMLEYVVEKVDSNAIRMHEETKKVIKTLGDVGRVFLLMALRNVEIRRVKIISLLESRIRSGILSSRQFIFGLTRKLLNEGRIEFPIEVEGINTYLGLRIHDRKVYVFLSTADYVVREVLDKRRLGTYVYFPSVDICIELRAEDTEDGRSIVFPVESPVIIDYYDHPSIRKRRGVRVICLGNLRGYVDRIINVAKDVAKKGRSVELTNYGITIVSVEQAIKEALVTTFRIMRYGYVPGANPYKHAVDCVGYAGVRVINRNEILELKNSGVEIIDPFSE